MERLASLLSLIRVSAVLSGKAEEFTGCYSLTRDGYEEIDQTVYVLWCLNIGSEQGWLGGVRGSKKHCKV